MRRSIDAARSSFRIRTFAEGLFAKLAHDLELVLRDVTGTADEDSAELTVPIDRIEVAGVVRGGKVDAGVLSASDRSDILAKMRREVFHGGGAVKVAATAAKVEITAPNGRTVTRTVRLAPTTEADGTVRVTGSFDVSLDALGSSPVKGPMNAFRVKDRVEVHFDAVLTA